MEPRSYGNLWQFPSPTLETLQGPDQAHMADKKITTIQGEA